MLKTPKIDIKKLPLKKADDLFEKSSMSFGDHLEELRKCLGFAVLWLTIGMLIAIPLADWVINRIQDPLQVALENFHYKQTSEEYYRKTKKQLPPDFANWIKHERRIEQEVLIDRRELIRALGTQVLGAEATPQPVDVPLSANVEQVAATTVPVATAVTPTEPIADNSVAGQTTEAPATIIDPPSIEQLVTLRLWSKFDTTTEALGLQEPFMVWLKALFGLGFVLASPGIFYSIWQFIAAGLYPHERRYIYFFLPVSLGLFLAGAALAFFVVFQFVIDFLLKFNASMNINAAPRLTDYMSFVLFLSLGFGISFQLPLVMLVLERLGLTSIHLYVSQWRIAILIIAFISMVLTPAEVTSMIAMCVPLIGLYFLGIAFCKYLPRAGSMERGYDPV